MSIFFQNKTSLFSQPYTSLFDRLNTRERLGEAGNRFLQGNPSIEDLRLLGYTQYCGSTSDCGYGSQCVDGLCRPIGAGNTQYGEGGCSNGPSSNPPATLDCINCGYDSERSCAGGRTCRFTQFGVTCQCGQSTDTNTGDPDGEEGKPCNKYCTTEYSSYGTYGPGCSDRNTCSECYSCEGGDTDNGNCTKKSRDDGAPCHCDPRNDENCNGDDTPLTCCNYRDTCEGRIPGLYCHDTYRTGYPRCYDPDYQCPSPDPEDPESVECFDCESKTEYLGPGETFELPEECVGGLSGKTGEIINDATGDKAILYNCCTDNGECDECSSDLDCPSGTCCNGKVCGTCSYPIPATIPCGALSYPPVGFGGAGGGGGGAYWSKPGSICDCYDIWVETFGSGYINNFTSQNCTTLSYVSDLTSYLESSVTGYGSNVIAVEVGHATNPSGCTSGTNVCPTFVPGDYGYYQACQDSGYLPRNGILKYYYYNTATGEISYLFQGLWGGNYNGNVGKEYEYEVKFQIHAQRRLTNCQQYNFPPDFRLQY